MITDIEQSYTLYQLSDDPGNIPNLPGSDTLVKALEEEDTLSGQEEENEESDSDEWELEPVKFIAIGATQDYINIVTNYWRAQWCNDDNCDEEGEHGHPVFDPRIKPREYVRRIRLNFCKEPTCKNATRVYTH